MASEHLHARFINEPPNTLDTTIHLKSTTPEANFGSKGASCAVPVTLSDAELAVVQNHQRIPVLYQYARCLADYLHIPSIIGVGCGDGELLTSVLPADRFVTVGINHVLPHIEIPLAVRESQPSARWVECHIGSKHALESAFSSVGKREPHVVILDDVLERLPDPRNLLHSVRELLLQHPNSRAVLSMVDRERLHGERYTGLPTMPYHVREWTLAEITSFLASCGFTVEHAGYLSSERLDEPQATCVIELSCQAEAYDAFLLSSGLAHTDAAYAALVTSEHATLATLAAAGRIGTYAGYVDQLAHSGVIPIYIGTVEDTSLDELQSAGWVYPSLFFDETAVAMWTSIEQAWKTTEHLLFFFHHLQVIECQDYQGLGARIGQAKRSGLISASIRVQAMCHGNQMYVDKVNETWSGIPYAQLALLERVALETADRVYFPSDDLYELYSDIGYDLGSRATHQRLPFVYSVDDPFLAYQAVGIDTLIFSGELSASKGLAHVVDAILALEGAGHLDLVTTLVILGDRSQLAPEWEDHLQALPARFTVTYRSLEQVKTQDVLYRYRERGLLILPYLGDQQPYDVLDVIDLGMSFVCYQRSGMVTLIPDEFTPTILAAATSVDLALHVERILGMNPDERQRLFHRLRTACAEQQAQINSACLQSQFHTETCERAQQATYEREEEVFVRSDLVSVVVPVYNTKLAYIRDLCFALNAQTLAPRETIFVNDGSQPGYVEGLEAVLTAELRLPWRLITQENQGTAGASNAGLNACSTRYLVVIGSDDVPTPDYIYNQIHRMMLDDTLWAVSSYSQFFHETKGEDWHVVRPDGEWYRPIAGTLVYGQVSNVLGSGSAAYHVERLRSIGGWDASDKSIWEDWACYLKIVSHGGKVDVVPALGFLYRVRADSISRIFSVYPAMRRLARNTTILPRWEAYSLQSMMRDYERLSQPHTVLFLSQNEQTRLLAEQNVMLEELRQWSTNQSTYIANLEQALKDLRQWSGNQSAYIANLEQALEEQRSMLTELREWGASQSVVISQQHGEIERLAKSHTGLGMVRTVLGPMWRLLRTTYGRFR